MVKHLEARVRALDDKMLSTRESAKRINLQLDGTLQMKTIVRYIQMKRRGENSLSTYINECCKKRGTTRRKIKKERTEKKFGREQWYLDLWANKKGFEDNHDYQKTNAQERYGFESIKQLTAFKQGKVLPTKLPELLVYIPTEELDALPNGETREQRESQTEILENVTEAFQQLSAREQYILKKDLLKIKLKKKQEN